MKARRSFLAIFLALLLPLTTNASREAGPEGFSGKLSAAAIERTNHKVVYDPAYISISYPNGDVPDGQGVCTDVVIRSYRKLGIDLQVDVHEEMSAHFNVFPKTWGLKHPDKNIDHRRVPNLQTLFERKGVVLPVTDDPGDYLPGDLVTWNLAVNLPHIGIVVDQIAPLSGNPLIVHNVGAGTMLDDFLFDYPITGHYRYYGKLEKSAGKAE